jgi:hypothetical protein
MAWTSLKNSLSSKPNVLAGPMLRKVTPTSVTVWLAMRVPCSVTLTVWNDKEEQMMGGTRATVGVGKNLHIVAVTARPAPPIENKKLKEGVVYKYDLSFDYGTSTHGLALATQNARLTYPPFNLPSFALPPQDLNHLRLLQGSCRLPHAEGKDAFPLVDDLIAQTAANPYTRPHQLLLTGDQIYADDVSDALLLVLMDADDVLLRWQEELPISEQGVTKHTTDFPAGTRALLLQSIAFRQIAFTSEDIRSHLMSLGEYLCMYLFVWSEVLWPDALPSYAAIKQAQSPNFVDLKESEVRDDTTSVAEFAASVWKVRRAVANIPSYMIFDDHEVTDDWNTTRTWCRGIYGNPLGLRIVQNGLTAYALCQHWGNAPEQFDDPSKPGHRLLQLLHTPTPASTPTDPFTSTPIGFIQKAAEYNQNSASIRSLLGVHDEAALQQRPDNAVFHDPFSLRYHYTVEGPGHQVIFTDTRTWRSFPRGGNSVPDFLPEDQFTQQILNTLDLAGRTLLVVLTTNAPAVQPIRSTARHARPTRIFRHYPDVYEAWEIPSIAFDRLLTTLTSKLPTDGTGRRYGRAILLSGDVHHSFASRLIYRANERFGDPKPAQAATAVFAQLVASSFKKEDKDTRGLQRVGYTYEPWYTKPLKFIPSHKPEGYVGWNVKLDSKLEVGTEHWGTARASAKGTLKLSQPTVPLWIENPNIHYSVKLKLPPHYRYRLDYLKVSRQGSQPPSPPTIPPIPPGTTAADREQAARTYKAAHAHYRLSNGGVGSELKVIGVNNFAEMTFDWGSGDNKKVNHTLRWVSPGGVTWSTYEVSLDPNDPKFPDIPSFQELIGP